MCKRFICILLILSLCVGCFVSSVSASDIARNDSWIDLFDYSPNFARTRVTNTDLPYRSQFPLPVATRLFYVEATIFYDGPGHLDLFVSPGSGSSYQLTRQYLGNYIYKFTGTVSRSTWDKLETTVWVTDAPANTIVDFTWLELKANICNRDYFVSKYSVHGVAGGPFGGDFESDNQASFSFYPVDEGTPFIMDITLRASARFDLWDFAFSFENIDIQSISASHGYANLPVSSSVVSNSDHSTGDFCSITVDYSSLAKVDYNIVIRISGVCYPYSSLSVNYCTGSLIIDPPNPIIQWLSDIWMSLQGMGSSIASSITSALTDFFDDFTFDFDLGLSFDLGIDEIISSIGDSVTNIIGGIQSFFTGIFDSVHQFFGDLIGGIMYGLNIVKDTVVSIWGEMSSIIDSIGTSASNIISSVGDFFDTLFDSLTGGFEFVVDQIKSFFSGLFNIEYRPPEIDSSVVDRVDGSENDYRGDVVDGMVSNDIVSEQADIVLLKYGGALFAVTFIVSNLIGHPFFTNILYFALCFGIIALVFNVVVSLDKPTNGNKKDAKFLKARQRPKKD